MIFGLCILCSLHRLLIMSSPPQIKSKIFLVTLFCLFLACFTLEIGWVYCLFFAGYLFLFIRQRTINEKGNCHKFIPAFILCLPAILYLLIYFFEIYRKGLSLPQTASLSQGLSLGRIIKDLFFAFYYWTVGGLFPAAQEVYLYGRTQLIPRSLFSFEGNVAVLQANCFLLLIGILLIFVYCWIIYKTLTWEYFKKRALLLLLIFILTFSYTLLIVLTRNNLLGFIETLSGSPYHSYFFWMYFVISLYLLMDFDQLKTIQRLQKIKYLSCILLIILILINGSLVYQMNSLRKYGYQSVRGDLKDVHKLIKSHGHKKGFSFGFEPSLTANPEITWVKFASDPPQKKYTFFELLYPQYYNDSNPKFTYTSDQNGFHWRENY